MRNLLYRHARALMVIPAVAVGVFALAHGLSLHAVGDLGWWPDTSSLPF